MEIFEQIYTEKERQKLKKKNIDKIKKVFAEVDPNVLELNGQLIEEAGTYATYLSEINKIIERDGFVDTYKNGENQYGTKKSVAAEMKPKYTTTYQSLIKQLTDLLPKDDDKEDDPADELLNFIKG